MRKRDLVALQVFSLFVALLFTSGLQAQLLDSDDFESYAVGSTIAGQGAWQTWDYAPGVDSTVENTFLNTTGTTTGANGNVLELTPNDDIVRTFGGLTSGAFTFTSETYIPSGQAGDYYFILLNTYDGSGSGYNWSGQMHMADSTGNVNADNVSGGGGTFGITTIVYDAWVEVRAEVDLDANLYQAFYNNVQIVTDGLWSNGLNAMQCLDLYNTGNPGVFYYDNVEIICTANCTCLPFDVFDIEIDCLTNDVTLNWTSFLNIPGGYPNGIEVLRGGVSIANLAGDASTYTDVAAPLGLLQYQLIGDCGGGETTSAAAEVACTGACPPVGTAGDECCDAQPAISGANLFDTTGSTDSPDPVDGLQCTGTFLGGFFQDMWFTYTAQSNSFLHVSACNTFDTDIAVYEAGVNCGTKTQVACNGDDVGGPCGVSSDLTFACTAGTDYIIRIGGWSVTDNGIGDLIIEELCDFGLSGLIAVVDCSNGDVSLSWNNAGFSNYDILRDGIAIATGLPFGTTSYNDLAVSPGPHTYGIVGNCATQGTAVVTEVSVNVQGAGGFSDLIVVGETPSGVDSSLALQTAMTNAGIFFDILPGGPGDIPCLTDASLERIWYLGGTYPSNRALNDADGTALVTAQQAGKNIYVESGDAWGFDAVTPFNAIDGVSETGIVDGDDTLLVMDGLDSLLGLDMSDLQDIAYTQDQAGSEWTDRLLPATTDSLGSAAALIWQEDVQGYGIGVYYDTDNGGKVMCQSWEFGGFGGDQDDLLARILSVLGGAPPVGPTFGRGDCNADGSFNIADAIFLLAALFSGGTPGTCTDACDSNDDGSVNIADAIYALAALFSGGPPPANPSPGTCGEDLTTDSIDCASFAPCP